MEMKDAETLLKDAKNHLMQYYPELFSGSFPDIFQYFLCPVAIMEADVDEYIVDEYDSAELLVLRLYKAGLRRPEDIASLTGINISLIQKLLNSEQYIYGHINPHTGEVTDMGNKTLEQNTDSENLFNYALFHVKREVQVDAVTGTLIKAEAEIPRTSMKLNNMSEPDGTGVLPDELVELDEELNREIRERLQYYIDEEYFMEGNTIQSINNLHTAEVRYRDAYYVHVKNFEYPFLAFKYKKYLNGKKQEIVYPVAISESDAKRMGIFKTNDKYLVRRDANFKYIKSLQNNFTI